MEYGAMTVNERLYISGKLESFDKAVKRKDVDIVINILKSVEVDDASIIQIIERLGFDAINLTQYRNRSLINDTDTSILNSLKNLFKKR